MDGGQGAGCPHPPTQQVPPGLTQTHFAESVLMEPVTSMSPARNNWYLVQAIVVDTGDHLNQQIQPGSPGMRRLLLKSFRAGSHMTPLAPALRPLAPPPSCLWSAVGELEKQSAGAWAKATRFSFLFPCSASFSFCTASVSCVLSEPCTSAAHTPSPLASRFVKWALGVM